MLGLGWLGNRLSSLMFGSCAPGFKLLFKIQVIFFPSSVRTTKMSKYTAAVNQHSNVCRQPATLF